MNLIKVEHNKNAVSWIIHSIITIPLALYEESKFVDLML